MKLIKGRASIRPTSGLGRLVFRLTGGMVSGLIFSTSSALALDCTPWNSRAFFFHATVETVTTCLAAGADPKARTPDGWTPLHVAARDNENLVIFTLLLEAGADPNARAYVVVANSVELDLDQTHDMLASIRWSLINHSPSR